jgi:hypothetical protein
MDRAGWKYPSGEIRVSDADRDQALSELNEAFQAGRITADEFEERSGQALGSRTGKELTALLADLPIEHAPAPHTAIAEERANRLLATRIGIGASAVTATFFALTALANALYTGPTLQQQDMLRDMMARQGLSVPPGFPANTGFDWSGTITPAVIAVLLVVVIILLRRRLARLKRTWTD